jgi:hypothetical protein
MNRMKRRAAGYLCDVTRMCLVQIKMEVNRVFARNKGIWGFGGIPERKGDVSGQLLDWWPAICALGGL